MSPAGPGVPGRAGDRRAPASLLTIGEVLVQLQPDFPDVSHSKIRFLEDRGLVSPLRTPSGYRKFSPADLDRLRFVLSLQRDRYLPLRVIGAYLAAVDRGAEPPPLPGGPVRPSRRLDGLGVGPGGAPGEGVGGAPGGSLDGARGEGPGGGAPSEGPAPMGLADRVPGRASRADLVTAAGGDAGLVDSLLDHGLLPGPQDGSWSADAADVVRSARDLASYGIQPRHLRVLRTAADREAALVEQVVSPLRRQQRAGSAERAEEVGREIATTLLRLHSSVLRTTLDAPGS